MRWIKFVDKNGGRRVFGNDENGGVFYQRIDGSWNRLNVKEHRYNRVEHFITFLEDTFHLGVKGFEVTEHKGGWD